MRVVYRMRNGSQDRKLRILVISSCGKAKLTDHPNKPTWQRLNTPSKRENEIKKFNTLLIKAGELYTGPQATAIREGLKILDQIKGITYDHFIVSAGFGLVREDTLLPPYESTFNGKSIRQIQSMAKELKIRNDFEKIQEDYDLVYLALGQYYLKAIGDYYHLKSEQIISFERNTEINSKVRIFNEGELISKNISGLYKPIGGYVYAKGRIFENFISIISKIPPKVLKNEEMAFSVFWESLKKSSENQIDLEETFVEAFAKHSNQ